MLNDDKDMSDDRLGSNPNSGESGSLGELGSSAESDDLDLEEMHLSFQRVESAKAQEDEDNKTKKPSKPKKPSVNENAPEILPPVEDEPVIDVEDIEINLEDDVVITDETAQSAKKAPVPELPLDEDDDEDDLGFDVSGELSFSLEDDSDAFDNPDYNKNINFDDADDTDDGDDNRLVIDFNIIDDADETNRPQIRLDMDYDRPPNEMVTLFGDSSYGDVKFDSEEFGVTEEETPELLKDAIDLEAPLRVETQPELFDEDIILDEIIDEIPVTDEDIDHEEFLENLLPEAVEEEELKPSAKKSVLPPVKKPMFDTSILSKPSKPQRPEQESGAVVPDLYSSENMAKYSQGKQQNKLSLSPELALWRERIKKDPEMKLSKFEEQVIDLTLDSGTKIAEELLKVSAQIDMLKDTVDDEIQKRREHGLEVSHLEEFKEQLVLQLVQLFEGISFSEDLYDLRTFMDENFVEIKQVLNEGFVALSRLVSAKVASKDITDSIFDESAPDSSKLLPEISAKLHVIEEKLSANIQSSSGGGDYKYGLVDVESDLAKMRVILDQINTSSARFAKFAEDDAGFAQFECLQDDISSISKRTNKLILTSDDAHKTLKHYMEDFERTIREVDAKTLAMSAYPQQMSSIHVKLDNLIRMNLSTSKSDKMLNDALLYLAQWIDSASENFDIIKKEFKEEAKRIDALEEKLEAIAKADKDLKSTLDLISAQVASTNETLKRTMDINEKFEILEHKISKFEKNINKIASYIEE